MRLFGPEETPPVLSYQTIGTHLTQCALGATLEASCAIPARVLYSDP